MIQFFAYRLSLTTQLKDKTDVTVKPKEDYFKELLEKLSVEKATFMVKNTKYFLYLIEEIISDVYVLELAREEIQNIPVEGSKRVEEKPIPRTPFVYVIIDRVKQIVLIENKTSVFQSIESSVHKLEHYFKLKLLLDYIIPFLLPITDKNEFWQKIESADGISEFDITFNAPNLFKGRQSAEDLVEEIHEEFNVTQFEIKLKNNLGKLKLLYQNAKDFVSLAAAGGGKYIVKYFKDGKQYVLKSFEFTKKVTYDADKPEDIDKYDLEKDLEEIDKINDK